MRPQNGQIAKWVMERASAAQRHIFSYLGLRVANYAVLVKGVLHINDTDSFAAPERYECGEFIAGYIEITHAHLENFCSELHAGRITIDNQKLVMAGKPCIFLTPMQGLIKLLKPSKQIKQPRHTLSGLCIG